MQTTGVLEELHWRGLVSQHTDGVPALLAGPPASAYIGFDPTGSSLHVGSLVVIMILVHLQRHGHRPVALVGGGTGMIGDPSGKVNERQLLSDAQVAANAAGIRAQLERFLAFDGPSAARMRNNADWLNTLPLVEFLRDTGKHFTVNYMLQKDSVKSRMDAGISFTEFSYMLLQAYDFLELRRRDGVTLQLGGTEQWGNITAGIELIRRVDGAEAHGLTVPLLMTSSGTKFGKTEAGAVWLDAARTSPYAFYQYWFNRADDEVPRLLKLFSLRPLSEIESVLADHDQDRGKRVGQRELARALTGWVHGDAAIASVEAASRVMFGGSLDGVTDEVLQQLAGTVPTVDIPRSEFEAGITLIDLLARTVCKSKGDAKRLIQQGGANVNNLKVTDLEHKVTISDLVTPTMLVVRSGKKDYCLVRVT